MELRPITLKEANAYVERNHRHHDRVVGHKWSLAAYKDGHLCGVAIVGRPTGRKSPGGWVVDGSGESGKAKMECRTLRKPPCATYLIPKEAAASGI